MFKRLKQIVLLTGDFFFLNLALFLALALRYPQETWRENFTSHWPYFLVVFLIWLVFFYINGLYDLNIGLRRRKFFLQTMSAAGLSSLFSIIYFYLNVQSTIAPKTNLFVFIAIFILIFFIWRSLCQAIIKSVLPKNNLAIIGQNKYTTKIIHELENNPGAGYATALIFKNADEVASLVSLVQKKNIKTIVLCDDFGQSEKTREALFACLAFNISFFDYPNFYELLSGKVPVEAIGPSWFLNNIKEGERNYFNFLKRIFDLIGALIIFILFLPVWPLIALIIKLESRGPVLFKQVRYGKNEKVFKILKFRTMRIDNNDGAPTKEGDQRVTQFGNFLRKTRLDEIPQVINILKSEMSFIGPRPERPEIVADLERQIPFYKTRLLIKPGISGWDQVSGVYHSPSLEDTLEKLQYDLFYLKHRSLYLDLAITLKTIATVLGRKGR